MYYVYALIDPRSNLPFYIGKGKNNRMYNHYSDYLNGKEKNEYKIAVFEKLSLERLIHTTHKIFDNLTLEDAKRIETEQIKTYGRIDIGTGILTNKTNGGEGCFNNKTLKKLSEASIAKHKDPEFKKKHSLSVATALADPDTKERQSLASKNKKRTPLWLENLSHSEKIAQNRPEVKLKKSLALSGQVRTSLQVENIRQGQLKIRGEVSKKRIGAGNPAAKKCNINGTEYLTLGLACDSLGLTRRQLSKLLKEQDAQ